MNNDLGERNDVAAQNPEVVKRLQELVARMNADLGTNKTGPGVRLPGRVSKPTGLWLPGQMPEFASQTPKPLDALKPGEVLTSDDAPEIAEKAFTISCTVEGGEGIIVAHGGVAYGYALHLYEGKLVFTVRENRAAVAIFASQLPPGPLTIEAQLASDGAMKLSLNGKSVALGKAPGPISRQPQENFCVGFDDQNPVGDYRGAGSFSGKISGLKIAAE